VGDKVAFRWAIAILVILGLAGPLRAQEKPWAKGVSEEAKAKAQAELEKGNELFLKGKHREALARYRAAIKHWDHPAIRFNIVRALINIDKPVEAYANLELALKYGKAPHEEQIYQEAMNYKRLLLGQIAEIEVSCTQAGVAITVDGQQFLSCPGTKSTRFRPGSHEIVGKKKGHLTETKRIVAFPGKKEPVAIKLMTIEDATITKRRWARWKPWAVTGAGALVAGIGGLLQLKAKSDFDQYGEEIAACGESGCLPSELSQSTRDLESRARLENRIAVGSMIVGGLTVAAGLTAVFLNRPRPYLPERKPAPAGRIGVVPSIGPQHVGLTVMQRF
jgi:hypothetical protein